MSINNEKSIDHEYTSNVICPYCGRENLDSWEEEDSEGDLGVQYCDACEKRFTSSRNVEVTYSSFEAPCLNEEEEHQWKPIVGIPKEFFEGKFRCKICGSKKEVR